MEKLGGIGRKKYLRLLAVLLCASLLITLCPYVPGTVSGTIRANAAQTAQAANEADAGPSSDRSRAADSGHTNHTGWIKLTSSTSTLTAGKNYYLESDVAVSSVLSISGSGTIDLCLNGYKLTKQYTSYSDKKTWLVTVPDGVTLNVHDCKSSGILGAGDNREIGGICVNGTLNVYGGSICGQNSGGSLQGDTYKTDVMALAYSSAVYAGSGSVTNLYGGSIEGKAVTCVYVESGAKLTVDGAEVNNMIDCTSNSTGHVGVTVEAIYVNQGGNAEVKSGRVSATAISGENQTSGGHNGSIAVMPTGSITISGGTVESTGERCYGISIMEDAYWLEYVTVQEGTTYANFSGGMINGSVSIRGDDIEVSMTGGEITGEVVLFGGKWKMDGSEKIGTASAEKEDIVIGKFKAWPGKVVLTGALTNPSPYLVRTYLSPASQYPIVFTENFTTYMPGKTPADFFTSVDGYKVVLQDGECALMPYVMTFDANGGTCDTATGDINGGRSMRTLPEPTRDGYTFDGWYTAKTGGDEITIDTIPEGRDITVYAHWTLVDYAIHYDLAGGELPSGKTNPSSYTIETAAFTLINPVRNGYTFTGWSGTDLEGNANVTVSVAKGNTGEREFTANWSKASYGITYNKNGGTIANESSYSAYTYGTGLTLPTPTRTGYTFGGWYANSGLTGTAVTKITTAETGAKAYYAKWTADTYAITYSGLDGATLSTKPGQHTYGTATQIGNPTKTGYTFAGWNINGGSTATKNLTLSETGYTSNITLKATWTANTYTVTYNKNGGTIANENSYKNYTYGTGLTLPTPARTGYTFGGWYANSSFSKTAVTKVTAAETGAKTYYAKWTADSYTITYDLNDGTVSGNPVSYTIESDDITLINPTKEGYHFAGWSGTDLTGRQTSVTIVSGSIGNRSYTANWVLADYTVVLHTNGGSGGTALTSYVYGTGAVLPENWTRAGYMFDGWFDNEGCSGEKITEISDTAVGDKEYWAKWTDRTAPVIGALTYSYQPLDLWQWLIGKDSLTITVPITEEGSGAEVITYVMTPEGGTAKEETAEIRNGKAEITVSDFKGTISITCSDRAGNTSAGVTVGTNGVLIEDRAPQIIFQAEHAELVLPGEYDAVPDISVTIADDHDNAVSSGIASVSYQIGTGSVNTVDHDYTTAIVANDSFLIPASEITGGETVISVTATDHVGNRATENFTVKLHTHSEELVPEKPATCTEPGLSEGSRCSSCGQFIEAQTSIAALGHEFSGNYECDEKEHWKKCIRCEETQPKEKHVYENDADLVCNICGYERTIEDLPGDAGAVSKDVEKDEKAPDTTLSNSEEELADIILTEEEKAQIENGTDIKFILDVKDAADTVSSGDKTVVQAALDGNGEVKGFAVGQYLDISIFKVIGTDRSAIFQTERKLTIVINVPDSLKSKDSEKPRTYAIIRVHEGVAETLTDLDHDADTITIASDRFSSYVVVYKEAGSGADITPGPTPDGGNEPGATPEGGDKPTATPDSGDKPGATPEGGDKPTATPGSGDRPGETPEGGDKPTATPDSGDKPGVTPEGGDKATAAPDSGNVKQTSMPDEKGDVTSTPTPAGTQKKASSIEKRMLELHSGLKATWTGKKLQISWGGVNGASGYSVYVQYCGKDFSAKSLNQVKSGKKTTFTVKKVNGRKLDTTKNFKFYVAAWKWKDGKKSTLAKTLIVHIAGKDSAEYTNVKNIQLKKISYTLKKGGTVTLRPRAVLYDKKKKQLSEAHTGEFRYLSSNKNVAKVTAAGKVMAKAKGNCTIYVFAKNGCKRQIRIKVRSEKGDTV